MTDGDRKAKAIDNGDVGDVFRALTDVRRERFAGLFGLPVDCLGEMRCVAAMVADLPPRPHCVIASHAVPYGRIFRQWDTRGRLLIWANRGEFADIPTRTPGYAIAPGSLDASLLSAIPVVFA